MSMPKERGVWAYYEIKDGKLVRRLPFCERCGPGVFMADHGDRWHCGKCGLTIYKQQEGARARGRGGRRSRR